MLYAHCIRVIEANSEIGLPQKRFCLRKPVHGGAYCRQHLKVMEKEAVVEEMLRPVFDRYYGIVEGTGRLVLPALNEGEKA